ncbi:DNA ligase [Candidatus Mycoplasma haematolamae str. Purdue]|uniref:DNA ligase n=1 Tax=Mycoplasma haematolamae (strain Purdue) TaxID=1212765 RepID=I7BIV9_MYCHA|nr:NAD-dependent DNA ligase LigA [Candidatus Mycoplasma haematolamae]AFO51763.1 DNA ligase [Candidatus Mycoplasma haematolamae str. Purdue]
MSDSKLKKLKEELLKAEDSYYKGQPVISDEEYDIKLREAETLGLDTQIGFVSSESSKLKHDHVIPMLSLDNAFNTAELTDFFESHKKLLGLDSSAALEYFLEPKIDGVSISLHYREGQLIEALSRGNGLQGESLLKHIREMNSIPSEIPYKRELLVRGEIYTSKSDFQVIQKEANAQGKKFMNSRNYVAGTLRLKASNEIKSKRLSFIAYRSIELDDRERSFNSQSRLLAFLRSQGIPTHQEEFTLRSSSQEEILSFIESFRDKRDSWDIPTDGLVVKLNDYSLYDQIGSTSKFPKWAIAFKYPASIKETILEKIETTVGRSGRITYLGKLKPVHIDGSLINQVSLHNFDNIQKLNLREGSLVQVYKSGEIIPQILGLSKHQSNLHLPEYQLATKCPCCSSLLVFRESNKLQYCTNLSCERQIICQMIYFCSKECLDIEGLSEGILTKLYREGFLRGTIDLFSLYKYREEIYRSPNLNIKEKTFNNLIASIERSKSCSPQQLLASLGIDYIGKEVAKLLLKRFGSLDSLFLSSLEEKQSILGVGPKSSQALQDWISEEKNRVFIEQLRELNFSNAFSSSFTSSPARPLANEYWGKTVAITGSFSISRDKIIKELTERYGMEFKSSLSSKIDYLLVGDNPGSKVEQAREKNISIISLEKVEKLLKS